MSAAGQFDGHTAVVTGGSAGIGLATARLLAARGSYVALADIDADSGEAAAAELRDSGWSVDYLACDVTTPGDMERVVRSVVEEHGRLDLAFNNAGIPSVGATLDEVTDDVWNRTLDVNLTGVWRSLKAELAVMKPARHGSIVNTASICGLQVAAMNGPYDATKHAVIGLTKQAAVENGPLGVRVNSVCPGYTHTALSHGPTNEAIRSAMATTVPLGRWADAVEIAEAVVWLLSDRASYVNGHSLVVDGGTIQQLAGPRD